MPPRRWLRAWLWLLVLTALVPLSSHARVLQARIARVDTAVASLDQVRVRLDWPADASQGDLQLQARAVDAPDLGYRWRDVSWRCALQRDGRGGWRCNGPLRAGRGRALQLSLDLGTATTNVVLAGGTTRMAVLRSAAIPDVTDIELTRVPLAWTQALLEQAWKDARFKAGRFDGRLEVHTPANAPMRVAGTVQVRDAGLETADASIAAERIGGRLGIDYRKTGAATLLALDGELRGGELLAGSTYVELPSTPVALQVDARQAKGEGWQVPAFAWRDGNALVAEGSAAFSASDTSLQSLDLQVRSADLAPLRDRYLSGQLALVGLSQVELRGASELRLRMNGGQLAGIDLQLHDAALRDPESRFGFSGLEGRLQHASRGRLDSELRWQGGVLYGLDFGATRLPLRSEDGVLTTRAPLLLPMLAGTLRFEDVAIRPPTADAGLDMRFALQLDGLDFGQLAHTAGLPEFKGTLSGRIPRAHYANELLKFDGGLSMALFDGYVQFSSLALERPFGSAPSLTGDIAFNDIDLLRLTEVLDVGSITGRLDGAITGLRLVDWSPVAFDAHFITDAAAAKAAGTKQRISQRAVQNISEVGDASIVAGLQARLIGLFDDFGYARLGIGCRLDNQVCRMSGLGSDNGEGSVGARFTIVEGAGLPRLQVVGFNRNVDWSTLVERIAAVGKGEVAPVVE